MSIFPFTQDVPELEERAAQELPVFRELAYDYENNCLKRKGGKTYLVEKDEAVRVWIYKALLTRRFVWPAYTLSLIHISWQGCPLTGAAPIMSFRKWWTRSCLQMRGQKWTLANW